MSFIEEPRLSWADEMENEEAHAELDISDEEFNKRLSGLRVNFKSSPEKQKTIVRDRSGKRGRKNCFKCGSSKVHAMIEDGYARFKPICQNCTEWEEGKKSHTGPENRFFLIKCDRCKGIENLGMIMIKPGIFKHR